jgi:hypothetical protein
MPKNQRNNLRKAQDHIVINSLLSYTKNFGSLALKFRKNAKCVNKDC